MAGQSAEIGTAYISVLPTTNQLVPAIKDAFKDIDKVGESQGRSLGSRITSGIGATLKVGAAGVGAAVGGALAVSITKGMGRLNALDQASAKLEALGNSGAEVKGIMDNALASVKGTAFGIGEAAGTAATMVASGVKPGQELESVLKGVADSAAIAGVGMDDMGLIWGKVAAKGKLDGETMAQMLERQIPIYEILSQKTGIASEDIADMVSKGKIDFETFSAAMNDYVGGGAKRMGETVQGAMDNAGAAMGRFGAALSGPVFAAAPALIGSFTTVFDDLTTAVGPAAEQIGALLTPALETLAGLISDRVSPAISDGAEKFGELAVKFTEMLVDPANWERVGEVFSSLRDTAERLWPSIESLAGSFLTITQNITVATWQALSAALNALAPLIESVLVPLVEKVAEFAEENPGAVQAMVVAFLGFKAVGAIAGPVGTAATALKNVGGAVKFLGGAFKGGGVAKGLVNVMSGIGSKNPLVEKMAKSVGTFTKVLAKVGKVASPVIKVLGTVVRFINPWVAGFTLVAGALTLFFTKTELGRKIWSGFVDKIQSGIEWIKTAFEGLKNLIAGGDFTSSLRDAFGWEEDHPMVRGILKIRDVLKGIPDLVKGITDILFKGDFTGLPFGIGEDSGIVDFLFNLREGFLKFWDITKRVFNGVKTVIVNTLGVIGTIVLTPFILAWKTLSWAIQSAWESIIKPAWDAMAAGAVWLYENAILPTVDWIVAKWNQLGEGIQFVWNWIKVNVIDAFANAIVNFYNAYIVPYLDLVRANWVLLQNALGFAWDWIKVNVIWAFQTALQNFYNAYVLPILTNVQTAWQVLQNALGFVWDWIKVNVIWAFQNALQTFYNQFIVPILQSIQDRWNALKDAMYSAWQWIDTNVLGSFRTALDSLKSFFGTVVDGISSVWQSLKAKLAEPINFMIDKVYNGGIAEAWDTIAEVLPLEPRSAKRLSPIGGYAAGGEVMDDPRGAVRGRGTGTSDSILARIANGEHILTAKEVAAAGGHQVVYAMRDLIKHGRPFSYDGQGNLVGLQKDLDLRAGDLAGAAPRLLIPGFAKGGEVRPMWESQLERAHKWAASRHGRPYVFGGSADGGGGTDCSGFMSGIADVIQGGNGARKWATGAFNGGGNKQMDSGPQGFVRGLGKYFSIGVSNGGPGGGHTAGTLGAVGNYTATNVESGGSPSMVKYGVGAVGADNSQFATQYNLPIGPDGAFVSGGAGGFDFFGAVKKWVSDKLGSILDPIKALLPSGPPPFKEIPAGVYDKSTDVFKKFAADKVENLGELASGVWSKITDLFDNGGVLESGKMAVNKSGKPEAVLTNAQWKSFAGMVKALPGATDAMHQAATSLDGLNVALGEWHAEMAPVVRKSAEDYATEQGTSLLSPMGLEGLIPLGQKLGERAWELYEASPYEVGFNGQNVTVEIQAESDDDLIRVAQFKQLADQVHGLDVRVNRRPAAATVTRGGAM